MDAIDRKPNIKEMTRPVIQPIRLACQEVSNESTRSGDGVDLIETDSIHQSTRWLEIPTVWCTDCVMMSTKQVGTSVFVRPGRTQIQS